MAHRRCGPNGIWVGHTSVVGEALEDPVNRGWTNYTMCFVPEVKEFLDKLHSRSEEDAKLKLHVAATGRIIEMVGLSVSLTTIMTSLFIFTVFRSLRNNRTRIHWHPHVDEDPAGVPTARHPLEAVPESSGVRYKGLLELRNSTASCSLAKEIIEFR
ncbi:PDF receptor-like [Macrobrachium nipponense]|uniref:PDF receptor-like n=1 Tax=Macrobrachium nipponense TaxID=159736 RepID=UPI0030C8235F